MTPAPDPKTMARTLRAEVRERRGVELTHSECLEVVARQLGAADWNTLAARLHDDVGHDDAGRDDAGGGDDPGADAGPAPARPAAPVLPWGAAATTIPVLRVFSVEAAQQFYVDLLGFRLDFGGPAGGPGTAFYGQVTRAATTLHLTETPYDARPGATVMLWVTGLEALREDLNVRRETVPVWGPAVWVPELEAAPWGARTLTVPDPFGNHLRFNEPDEEASRAALPDWSRR